MRRLIHKLFFPPAESSRIRRYSPWIMLSLVPIAALLVTPATWEYSNSPKFCGTTCHTMPPEYQTYQVSPHARVLCVDCHIGRDSVFIQAYRKSAHMTLLYKTAVGDYEYPIRVGEMRPARDTCEHCHYPQKFSDDSLRVLNRFEADEDNTPFQVYLLMHTGGGVAREGLGRGIHWHIENKIEYIALDPEEQEIPWVRVNTSEGETIEYLAENAAIDTANLDDYTIHEMDCITCHNRISHLLETPSRLVDSALARGDLSVDMPFIRLKAVELLTEHYESSEDAYAAFETLSDYYRDEYPDFYADNQDAVADAITQLGVLYTDNTFPEQELNWQTHPNNIGHRESPGCFRCHDGEHFNDGDEAIRLECNLCHSIPEVVRPGEIEPMLPLTTGIEPSSHLDSTWITRHHNEINASCSNCHTLANAGGTTDESFCSNSACHGTDWEYAGFDAPTLAIELGFEPEATATPQVEPAFGAEVTFLQIQPIFEAKCSACHGATPTKGLRLTDYESALAGSDDGPVIVPGDAENSLILSVLAEGHFAQLDEDQTALLEQWIAAGAPEGEVAEVESSEAAPEQAGVVIYADLQEALQTTCGMCHGETATMGLNVTTYATLLVGGDDGPVVVPGDPENSPIVQVQAGEHYANLDDETLALLEQWITAGAPEGDTPATDPATDDESDE